MNSQPEALKHAEWLEKSLTIGAKEAAAELRRLYAEVERLRFACSKMNDEVSQILGKALGYAWFKDDQKNFPGSTEADGVCVGDHVAESLASEAAEMIKKLARGRVKWQPIATAPTNVDAGLIYLARLDDDGNILELDYDGAWEYWEESWEMSHINGWDFCSANGIEEPTHWAWQTDAPPAMTSWAGLTPEEIKSCLSIAKLTNKPGVWFNTTHVWQSIERALEKVKQKNWNPIPDQDLNTLVNRYCNLMDNLGDLPIPDLEEWAAKHYKEGSALLQKNDYFRYLQGK